MVAEKGASGDFDDRRDESDGVDVFDEENDSSSEADFVYLLAEDEPRQGDGFDAFDENNWVEVLSPVPTPWYRSPQARTLLIASGIALSAIVISVVLLMFRETPTGDRPVPAPTTTPVTTPTATESSEPPPPEPPPPPPPEPPPESSTMERAPAVPRPTVRPRPTKEPEIGVTRTPATRAPISVAPQPRGPRS